ncbi:MAG: glycosyltransferase family 2 protein [Candidatus Wallbacteria bacterium]|nr:glycosyltransferase family 2 protein [Candidatus Wallbacteria bacterium]
MKISIITVVLNNEATIEDSIKSVACQTFQDIEHIVVDGGSKDRTLGIISRHRDKISVLLSEPDMGMYDALNKGIRLASGDVIGVLNSDDVFSSDTVLERVMRVFTGGSCDAVYGDLVFVNRDLSRIIRCWKAGTFSANSFGLGWTPPHPAFFLKKSCYEKYGMYAQGFHLAADYELLLRLLMKEKISAQYLPETLVLMRAGGKSRISFSNTFLRISEITRAWKSNDRKVGMHTILLKFLRSALQFYALILPDGPAPRLPSDCHASKIRR